MHLDLLSIVRCSCMTINVRVQYNNNGGPPPDIIILTQYHHHRGTRLKCYEDVLFVVFAAYDPT